MSASSSRGRSSSPFQFRRTSSGSYTSTSSSSPAINGSRSITPSRTRSDPMYTGSRNYGGRTSSGYASADYTAVDHVVEAPRSGDSISVTIRFRPLSERELQRGDEVAWCAGGDKIVRSQYNPAIAYAFDRVFGPSTSSQDVYEVAASPVVKAAMEGVNGTVFAYGVTSSGKTHTMHGDQVSPGIIPLAIKDVFSIIQDTPGREFLLRVSYLEIYNEVINDLLDPTGQNLRVREDSQGTYVEGIKEEVVLSPGHALSFIAAGEEHRHVGSNNFNLFSSRSHTIFTLMIESSPHGDEYDGVIFSQLNLIDLAGSESSKTETVGLRRKEGSYINKSLLTLGTVIGKLSEGKASHVPYRDSKLTRLLQSSLGGHGHVSLICTVTPASSNTEETHNTLKFASRAKRVEIYASRNKIIDEKSLIKKYQKEITCLKHELDQLRKGMLVGISHDEILSLRQQLEDGQVKMQSRLEEEEEAKAALMSRIQRLTKLILVSTKNTISPGYLNGVPSHQRSTSVSRDDKFDVITQSSVPIESESQRGCCSPDPSIDIQDRCHMELPRSSATPEPAVEESVSMSDQMDLLVEQVKMLAGEIAFCSSTLKRLTAEQSMADDPDIARPQIENLEREIEEKKNQMRSLEQRIMDSSEPSADNPSATAPTSAVDMQETITRLSAQCNEKGFELEIKSADNRILQEQLQNKCSENAELQQKVDLLQQQLASAIGDENELKRNIHFQEMENEELRAVHIQLSEEISGLRVQNQKMSEEASYAKELASAAAVELKSLASEVTKLSMQNSKLEKDLIAACELANSRSRKSSVSVEGPKFGRRGRFPLSSSSSAGRSSEVSEMMELLESGVGDGGPEDVRKELQVRRQREAALEAALTDKEFTVCEYQKSMDEAKKREAALENDLANMWVLVAQLKKEGSSNGGIPPPSHFAVIDPKHTTAELLDMDSAPPPNDSIPKEEPLVARLKARVKEMKEKQGKCGENGNTNITYFL